MALPRYSSSQSILGDESKPATLTKSGSVSFEVKLFFATITLLSWPVSMMYFLYQKPSVAYWFGKWEIMLAYSICIWIVVMYFTFLMRFMGKGTAMVLLLVLPCAALAITCEVQELEFQMISERLLSADCSSSGGKTKLQEAWLVAQKTSFLCDQNLMKITGSSKEELEKVKRIENCPGYFDNLAKYQTEWNYLAHLEEAYQCGGWCSPGYPLWTMSKTPLDSCSLAAGSAMQNSIKHMGKQVAIFSFIVLVGVSLWLLLAPKWAREED